MRPASPSHTVIIGAGIIGISAAYELARRGHPVTVLDQGEIACGASFGNAGIIAVGHTPLPRPGLAWNAIRWMLNRTSPLHIRPSADPQLLAWLWRFWRCCNATHVDRIMPSLAALGWLSMERFEASIRDEQLECDFHRAGWMEVFESEAQMKHGVEAASTLKPFGIQTRQLVGSALRDQNPVFREHVHGAILYTDSAFADPERYVIELARAAQQHGAIIRSHAAVRRIDLRNNSFAGVQLESGESVQGDVLVIAAGAWTTPLAQTIGVSIPMQPAKGYHLDLDGVNSVPMTTCVLAETFVAVTPLARGLRLAGTLELSGINNRIDRRRVDMLRRGAARFMHGLEADIPLVERSVWCGLRPCTADGMPVIGWCGQHEGVYVATGHAMMGFTLGPGTGYVIASEILDGRPPANSPSFPLGSGELDLQYMRPDRFR